MNPYHFLTINSKDDMHPDHFLRNSSKNDQKFSMIHKNFLRYVLSKLKYHSKKQFRKMI